MDGYPGSAFPRLLLPTVAINLNLIYGQIWCHSLGANRHAQTAYFHRQLKCGLKAQTNTDLWMEDLPLVLLRIQTALKEDNSSTAAELVYGTTQLLDPSNYLTQLKAHMQWCIHSSPPWQPLIMTVFTERLSHCHPHLHLPRHNM